MFCEVKVLVAQSSLTLWGPMDWSLPGVSVHGSLQVRKLEWVAITFSRVPGSSPSGSSIPPPGADTRPAPPGFAPHLPRSRGTPTPLALWMREASGLWALLAMSCLPGSSQVHFNFLLQGSQWLLHRATAPQLCSTGSLFSISTASLHLLLRCGLRLIHKAGFQ